MMAMAFLIFSLKASEDLNIVAVGEAQLERDKLALLGNYPKTKAKLTRTFHSIVLADFGFYKKRFEVLNISEKQKNQSRYWGKIDYKENSYRAELYDLQSNMVLANLSGEFHKKNLRQAAHTLADRLYRSITQKKSIFLSKIIFVSDRHGTRKRPVKELYMMDFDGKGARRLTHHKGMVISPAFSLDHKKVLYSLIRSGSRGKKNINLRLLNLETGKGELLSKRAGINSGAVFAPDGKHIVLTLSHQGNAELYEMNLESRKLRRITKHYSPDVDPSLNRQGDKMAFLSGRGGRPMIYTMNPRELEKEVKRVSFVGAFNATPRFNPEGNQIVFASWLDNRFDLFRIDEDGGQLYRLTKNFGSNEDPTYSNDGQFIAFSSQRVLSRKKAIQNIYMMTSEGEILQQLTHGLGNCTAPRWSK